MKTAELHLTLDLNCSDCQDAVKVLRLWESKQNKKFYATRNKKTRKEHQSFNLVPDFNCEGYLTHWHLRLND